MCSSLVCSEPTVCGNWSGVTFDSWCEKVQIETESIRGSLIRSDTTSANHLLANTNWNSLKIKAPRKPLIPISPCLSCLSSLLISASPAACISCRAATLICRNCIRYFRCTHKLWTLSVEQNSFCFFQQLLQPYCAVNTFFFFFLQPLLEGRPLFVFLNIVPAHWFRPGL